ASMRRGKVGLWQVVSTRQTCPAARRRGSSRQGRPVRRTRRTSARSPDPSEPPPPKTALQLALGDLHRLDQRWRILEQRAWRALVDIVGAWVAHQNAESIDDEWAST